MVSSSCKRPDDEPVQIRFAVAELRDGHTPEELVEMAGLAMTAAKLDGADKDNWLRAPGPAPAPG